MVIHKRIREEKPSLGHKLLKVRSYMFCLSAISREDPSENIWTDYSGQIDPELATHSTDRRY